jgi:hypothetical protein
MPTSTKKTKTKPAAGRKQKNKKNGGLEGAIAGLASNLRPARKSTRAQKSSNRRLGRIAAGAGVGTPPQRPSRKGLVGIAAGAGLGGVAMAQRRRRARPDEATTGSPAMTTGSPAKVPAHAMQDVSAAAHPDHANDPNGGGEDGDPKGLGCADAA